MREIKVASDGVPKSGTKVRIIRQAWETDARVSRSGKTGASKIKRFTTEHTEDTELGIPLPFSGSSVLSVASVVNIFLCLVIVGGLRSVWPPTKTGARARAPGNDKSTTLLQD